jgi:hypothetical protein
VPALAVGRSRTTVYGLAIVDDRGRVADGTLLHALAWTEHTHLSARLDARRILIRPSGDAGATLARRGRLLLPLGLRRGCRIQTGDRVLLAAEPADGILTVYPPAVLDELLHLASGPLAGAA